MPPQTIEATRDHGKVAVTITQELDNFASEYGTQIEHKYVDSRSLADEIKEAFKAEAPANPKADAQPRQPHLQPAVAN